MTERLQRKSKRQTAHNGCMEQMVTRTDLESLLSAIARRIADPGDGVFGPGSMMWKVSCESALFLGSGRAALMQLAHPWVAAAIAEHSTVLGDPIARFHNTFRIVFTMIFGSREQAFAAARHLHTLHTGIRGKLPRAVAGWEQGARYEANEIAALRWVYATLIEGAVLAYRCVLPLDDAEREQYYQESLTLAALFGIPSGALPVNWHAFENYIASMIESSELGVSEAARSMGEDILRGAGSWIHPPHWYGSLTAEWMPRRFRQEFGLTQDEVRAGKAQIWLRRFYGHLPGALRFVGPCREAQARLRGRSPNFLTQTGNRFWIGQRQMPFADRDRMQHQAEASHLTRSPETGT